MPVIHSFLLIGQSNMGGRGHIEELESPVDNPEIMVLRNGRWQLLFRPVNCDRRTSRVCLAETFADDYAKEHGVTVGLIPCADGGTCLDQWRVGGLLYDNAVYQSRLALRTSTIAGVLWHQGESDCKEEYYPFYREKLTKIMESFRRDLDLYDVPFLVGGLGDFLKDRAAIKPQYINYPEINKALREYAGSTPMTGFVSAEGLGANPDNLHFNAPSLYEFGHRYYEVFKTLENRNKIFPEKYAPDDAIRDEIELL